MFGAGSLRPTAEARIGGISSRSRTHQILDRVAQRNNAPSFTSLSSNTKEVLAATAATALSILATAAVILVVKKVRRKKKQYNINEISKGAWIALIPMALLTYRDSPDEQEHIIDNARLLLHGKGLSSAMALNSEEVIVVLEELYSRSAAGVLESSDILLQTFSFLSVEEVLTCSSVSRRWFEAASHDSLWRETALDRALQLRRQDLPSSLRKYRSNGSSSEISKYQIDSLKAALSVLKQVIPSETYEYSAFYNGCDSKTLTSWRRFLALVSLSTTPYFSTSDNRPGTVHPGKALFFILKLWEQVCPKRLDEFGIMEVLKGYVELYAKVSQSGFSVQANHGFVLPSRSGNGSISCSHKDWLGVCEDVDVSSDSLINMLMRYDTW